MRRLGLMLAALLSLASPAAAQVVVEYYHVDALGSVRAVTDAAGATIRTHAYTPFGHGEGTSTGAATLRFTAKERDPETGFDYFGARYYGSRIGRFTTVDPLMGAEVALFDPQRWNRYSYVGNRPLRVVDPDGRGWGSALFKVGKAVVKGGSIAQEFVGIYEDAKTVVSSESTMGQRAWSALSLASEVFSPVSIGDAKGAASWAMRHVDDAASLATRRVDAVIGHLDAGYAKVGRELGVAVFDVKMDIWNKMTPDQRRQANQAFLDRLVDKRKNIRVVTNNGYIKLDSALEWEIEYLLRKGYRWSDSGDMLLPK